MFISHRFSATTTVRALATPATGEIVTVTDGVETTGINFHLAPSSLYGTISGYVFDAETNLPMANVYVGIPNTLSARTDEHGFYSISQRSDGGLGLITGQYPVYAEIGQPYFVGLSGGGNCSAFLYLLQQRSSGAGNGAGHDDGSTFI